jgi:hypothetical protein
MAVPKRSRRLGRRLTVVLPGLVLLPILGSVPPADAAGVAACTISGTITFSSPSTPAPREGVWTIDPAVIDCHGLFNTWERILGPGSFTGSGTFTMAPHGGGACVQHVGSGTVDYRIPTSEQDVHLVEDQTFALAGAGSFRTPSLGGTFQLAPPHDGERNCLTEPVTRAVFVAQALMVRFRPPLVERPDPAG